MNFKDKKIAVIGFGVEGASSASYLASKGALVTVLDANDIRQKIEGINFKTGSDYLSGLTEYDVIVRSPGISPTVKELVDAKEKGVLIASQTQLFLELCPGKVIGITGTKGKGTTSSLIYEMLKKEGKDAYLGGNIGLPPFAFLDKLTPQSWVVLELSSFQLLDTTISPHIAVMLMVTQEHLAPDRKDQKHQTYHADIMEYVGAKRNILRFQKAEDFAIINRDYPASNESDIHTDGKVLYVSRERETEDGCFALAGTMWIQKDGNRKKVIDLKEIKIPGKHNWENGAAAAMAADLAGVSVRSMREVLATFPGLEHRLELVGEVNGATYYNDSFSTTPETAIAAIKAFNEPEVVILGGAHKGSDFTELGKVISETKNIRAIVGIGSEWPKIKEKITNPNLVVIEGAKDMETIVKAASKLAQPGDVVLLSPACSSFDMFPNYQVRGKQFKEEVNKLVAS
jgi:UDP-N-acetylmuramoylalanine--D-glutamate ligase